MQVLGATMDGAAVNRWLIKFHDPTIPVLYKVKNPYAEDGRELLFFSDPPHLSRLRGTAGSLKTSALG